MEEATFRFGCSATWLDEALAFANSELHLRLQNPQQREIQLVPMPVPVPGAGSIGVNNAVRAAQIPQCPPAVQAADHVRVSLNHA